MGIVTFAIAVGYDGPSRSVVQRSLRNRVHLKFTFIYIFFYILGGVDGMQEKRGVLVWISRLV